MKLHPKAERECRFATGIRVALGLAGAMLWGTAAADLAGSAISLRLEDGMVIGLTNRWCGEAFVVPPHSRSLPAALHRVGEPLLKVGAAREATTPTHVTQSCVWTNADRFELRAQIEPASGDVLITQSGESTAKKLAGISWSLGDVPGHFEILVPGGSGQRFSAESPAGRREFDYPMLWEASFVLLQGRTGGFLIRAEDHPPRYKNLLIEHTHGAFRLRFESRNVAPFEEHDRIESGRWRLTAYRGSWQAGAALYRQWAESQRPLVPLEQQRPAWVRDIRLVVTMNLDLPLLTALARHCRPAQTLLYLPNWRRDGYDRNYPDYTAAPDFDRFVAEAHRLGFRVMPHVNYFGCDPKHALYERFKPFQVRDPFSKALLWWEWPADPPIRFAYINPANRAWRELLVARLREVVAQHRVDAFHLDQTLCIYNDANGRMDGLTCLEGNLALHGELRAALPEVALSGEGLNEITGQYEAFAQRHVWGMDHAQGTWDDRLIAMAHPVSSAVLTPYTHLYGYLGLVNPASAAGFVAWRRAYERFGVLPTYAWPEAAQLDKPPPYLAEVLEHARFFQEHQPVPDYAVPWATNEVFVYRLAHGGRASFRRDRGTAFGTNAIAAVSDVAPFRVLTRRIEGVTETTVDGSIPDWPAYDAGRVFGLDPRQAYPWSTAPRDLAALHLGELPAGVVVEQSGRHAEFARFRFRSLDTPDRISLWDFGGEVTAGVRFSDGATRATDTLDFEDEDSGGTIRPDGEGLFVHPPWKGTAASRGRPVTFVEFALRLPAGEHLEFQSGVHLRAGAAGKSDGVTFRVGATDRQRTRSAEVHHAGLESNPLRLDLTEFAGAEVRVRLEADAGPKSDPTFDWGRFAAPQVRVRSDSAPAERTVVLAGVPAPFAATNVRPLGEPKDGRQAFAVPVPGALILALAPPAPVAAPGDLLALPFTSHVVFGDGIERAASGYFRGSVTVARCGGVQRKALSLHPPPAGRSLADYLVRLPEEPVRLSARIGIADGARSKGVTFAVQVNAETQFTRSLAPGSGWVPVAVALAPWRGQGVLLTLVTDAEGGHDFDWAVWGEPQIEAQ